MPDGEDQCPRQNGSAENGGCVLDADADFIPDEFDGCPNEPGDGRNDGCPPGVLPPDSDGDGAPDIYDRCPNEPGGEAGDCPDRDGDFVPDIDDQCPDEAGDGALQGCVPIMETSLPGRTPITTANAANLSLLGELRIGAIELDVAANDTLIVQTFNAGLLVYDLTANPIAFRMLESQTGQAAISGDGARITDTVFDLETGTPAVTVWDVASNTSTLFVQIPDEFFINTQDLAPDGSIFATAHGSVGPSLARHWQRVTTSAYGIPPPGATSRFWRRLAARHRWSSARMDRGWPSARRRASPSGMSRAVRRLAH